MARSLFVLSAAAALLLACAAAVSAADVEAKLLGDFLLQGDKGSNAKVKVASAGYKDKDYKDKEHKSDYKANDYPDEYKGKGYRHHTVNLALINFKNCAVYVSGASYVESDVACPPGRHDYDYGSLNTFGQLPAGTCQTSIDYFANPTQLPVPNHPGVDSLAKIGSFTTRCLMGANAEACASPLCDGATIVITGDAYNVTGALSAGNPGAPINVGTCIDATRRFNRQLQGADEEPAKASTAAYGYDRRHDGYGYGHYHADPMVYYEGTAVVLWGTIDSITTPKHSIAATGGYAQSVPIWESDGTPFTGSTENRLIIKPYTQQLKLQTEDKY